MRRVILPTLIIISPAPMMTNWISLTGIGMIAQMRERTILLATTPNLTQKSNYLYHLIYQLRNQQRSNRKIKLMPSYAESGKQISSHQKRSRYAMLVNFRSRHLSVIILSPFLNKSKTCQSDFLKKSYHS